MSSPLRSDINYRADIDGLRAIAVLSTIAFHCFPKIFSNGYVSVDVFFVISGFLITSIIINQSAKDRFSLVNFYSRRIKRILPPTLLVLGAVTLTGIWTLFENEFWSLESYIGPAAAFYVNFRLMQDTFYFSFESAYKPLLHYWSLAVEEQFYLVWPLIFSFQYKLLAKKSSDPSTVIRWLGLSTFALLIPSLAYFLISQRDLYFSSFARVWELMMGCMAATFYYQIKRSDAAYTRYLKLTDYLSITGFLLLVISLACERKFAIVLAVIGAFLLVLSAEDSFGKRFLKLKFLNYLGLMSFSLYLWHWPVLSFYHMFQVVISPLETLALVALIFILSAMTYHLIEKPLKNRSWDIFSREDKFNSKNLLPVAACLAVSVFFYVTDFNKVPDVQTSQLVYVSDKNIPANNTCLLTDTKSEDILETWCLQQNDAQPEQGLLIGDSQAHALYRGMVFESKSVSWHLVAAESCSPYLIPSMYDLCRRMTIDSFRNIEKHSEIKHVIFVMANHLYLDHEKSFLDPKTRTGILNQLRRLIALNKKIYLARPTPEFPYNIGFCSRQRFSFYKVFDNSKYCQIGKEEWTNLSRGLNAYLDALKEEVPELEILDATDVICDNATCYATRSGKAIYQDKSHLSFEGNRQLAFEFLKVIK